MNEEKIVFTELCYKHNGHSEPTPFYCKESEKYNAEFVLNTLIERKAKKLLEKRAEQFIKDKIYSFLNKQ